MRKPFLFIGALSIVLCLSNQLKAQTYAPLWIPDTLSGTEFNLAIRDTFSQLRPDNQAITGGKNAKFWGPTLFNKIDV